MIVASGLLPGVLTMMGISCHSHEYAALLLGNEGVTGVARQRWVLDTILAAGARDDVNEEAAVAASLVRRA